VNEEALAHWGLSRQKQTIIINKEDKSSSRKAHHTLYNITFIYKLISLQLEVTTIYSLL